MNQRIFLILSITLISLLIKRRKKISMVCVIMLIPIAILSLILILKPSLLGPVIYECLTGEWSYYTCELKNLLKCSLAVIYYILCILFILIILVRDYKLTLVLYLAALFSNLCFITSNFACERTQFISNILLMIITLYYLDIIINRKTKYIIITAALLIITYNSIKYIYNYSKQYDIFLRNEMKFKKCSQTKCKVVEIEEHDYRYIFKSDINFEDQKSWLFGAIRKYYKLDNDTIISVN